MRAHGTRACYVFGPEPGSDRSRSCRCDPCTVANRVYARERERRAARVRYGIEPPPVVYVDAGEVRAHLRYLTRKGMGLRSISIAARCSRSGLADLRSGRRTRCTPGLAERILLVAPVDAQPSCCVDASVTWKLVDELLALGHTRTELARMLGSTARVPALQLRRDRVLASTARKVRALHDELTRGVGRLAA